MTCFCITIDTSPQPIMTGLGLVIMAAFLVSTALVSRFQIWRETWPWMMLMFASGLMALLLGRGW